jgi:hypothetical protein
MKTESNPRRLRRNELGNMLVAGAIALIGALLLVVGLAFAFQKGVAWPTPTGYVLFGIAVLGGAAAVTPARVWGAYVAIVFALAGAGVLVGHYLGYF